MDHGRLAGRMEAFNVKGEPVPIQRLDVTADHPRSAGPASHHLQRGRWLGGIRHPALHGQLPLIRRYGVAQGQCDQPQHSDVLFLEDHEDLLYTLLLKKPSTHYAATSLPRVSEDTESLTFQAQSYRHLDNPMLSNLRRYSAHPAARYRCAGRLPQYQRQSHCSRCGGTDPTPACASTRLPQGHATGEELHLPHLPQPC